MLKIEDARLLKRAAGTDGQLFEWLLLRHSLLLAVFAAGCKWRVAVDQRTRFVRPTFTSRETGGSNSSAMVTRSTDELATLAL